MNAMVRLVNPEAPPPAAAAAGKQRDFQAGGIRLGVLDNSKGNADHLLKFIVEGVKAQMKVASVVALRKPSPSIPAGKAVLDELTEKADCVISAMADWGSCTSWSVHDMAELRKRGLVTAVICTDPFLKLGKAQSRVFGVPDLPLIVIPHPLGGISLEKVEGRAEVAIPEFVKLIKEYAQ